jgi:hypothetical protein
VFLGEVGDTKGPQAADIMPCGTLPFVLPAVVLNPNSVCRADHGTVHIPVAPTALPPTLFRVFVRYTAVAASAQAQWKESLVVSTGLCGSAWIKRFPSRARWVQRRSLT